MQDNPYDDDGYLRWCAERDDYEERHAEDLRRAEILQDARKPMCPNCSHREWVRDAHYVERVPSGLWHCWDCGHEWL